MVRLKGAEPLDDLTDRQLKPALDAEFGKEGLTKTDGDDADEAAAHLAKAKRAVPVIDAHDV